jgi:hypothetical protein
MTSNCDEQETIAYLIWHIDPKLAVSFGRWDAESLGARSTFIASLALLGLIVFHWDHSLWVFLAILAVTVVSGFAYTYHSERALNARFDMILALLGYQQRLGSPTEATQ